MLRCNGLGKVSYWIKGLGIIVLPNRKVLKKFPIDNSWFNNKECNLVKLYLNRKSSYKILKTLNESL